MIVKYFSSVLVDDIQSTQGLVILRVMSFNVQLQGVGTGIVLCKQRLTDFWYPLGSTHPLVVINGLSCPQRNVVQMNKASVCPTIYQCA